MTVKQKYGLLVGFLTERFGFAPREILNAIENPRTPYGLLSDALLQLDGDSLWVMIVGGRDGKVQKSEPHKLFTILPDRESPIGASGIAVRPNFEQAFKTDFVARKVVESMTRWAHKDSLALYKQVSNMGAPASALLGWLYVPLSMQRLSEFGSDLHVMEETQSTQQSITFTTLERPEKATE